MEEKIYKKLESIIWFEAQVHTLALWLNLMEYMKKKTNHEEEIVLVLK